MSLRSLSQLQFFSSPLAKQMLRHEKYWLRKQLRTCVGSHAALITSDPYARCESLFCDFYIVASASDDPADRNRVCCMPEALPFPNASLDVVVLQHVTELSSNPVQILREAERVLVPGGRLLIMTENPVSLFGLARWAARRQTMAETMVQAPASISRFKDWLAALDIQIVAQRSVFHELPINNETLLSYTFRWAIWCARHFIPFGGVYCVNAIKVARPVNPLRLKRIRWNPVIGAMPTAQTSIQKNDNASE